MRGFWYVMGGSQQGPSGSQAESCELALALADLCRQTSSCILAECLPLSLGDLGQVFSAPGSPVEELYGPSHHYQPKALSFIVASCYRRKPHLFTCIPPGARTEKQKIKVPGLRSHGGVQFLGMWKLAKLLERWPGSRSVEIPLHVSAAACSTSLR
uniref:Uncharacterized protein n=1 Tax=Myotis myotis TaxID=51298 RepID=A0A7J7TTM1_MYOMY|nr:hypothetical protein mMyoMyo1_008941 [Myotis myotis]